MPNNNETYITGLRVVKGRKKSQCLNLSNARIKSYAEIEQMTEDELQGVIICPDYPLEDGHLVPSSAIGYEDGTVEDALDDLYSRDTATVRYNEETDRFEVKINGTWVPSIKAYAQALPLFLNGVFHEQASNGVYRMRNTDDNSSYAWSVTESSLYKTISSGFNNSTDTSLVFNDAIDLSRYDTFYATTSAGNVEINISNISESGYAYIGVNKGSGGGVWMSIGLTRQKQYFWDNKITDQQIGNMHTLASVSIYTIGLR